LNLDAQTVQQERLIGIPEQGETMMEREQQASLSERHTGVLAEREGINIHRLNFANNTGKFLLLLPTLPVTCDRAHHHFTSIVGKTNMARFGSNGSHFRS
jgi:hypothetical protein